jgi:RNA polymerase sigma-70 factor (ECF subfamily)
MVNEYFLEDGTSDSQLRMPFACCHPAIPPESRVVMCLKILCGLSIKEIARAFLTAPDMVEK